MAKYKFFTKINSKNDFLLYFLWQFVLRRFKFQENKDLNLIIIITCNGNEKVTLQSKLYPYFKQQNK